MPAAMLRLCLQQPMVDCPQYAYLSIYSGVAQPDLYFLPLLRIQPQQDKVPEY
ncbi:hypothetical protein D3C71_1428640 [compost metagenome]